ncbi:MAG: Sulfurtransferase [uncultured Thiotrichaceae bacterium]|uniref:Sulfurtransferase n=1 Tax=uncultured Thiotrichaceae bacterium TaxID=298394 RepID=A0A6S6TII2_9GAMM|nr:MAG: Sulfurtransferase [uncultured Thiotrichaceae bacterium]
MKKIALIIMASAALNMAVAEDRVGITADLMSVMVKHQGKDIEIKRDQDPDGTVTPDFALTGRACPPFCIQPAKLEGGVETIAEIEVLDYLKKKSAGDDSIIVIDSRTPDWVSKGTIPGSVNISWTELNPKKGATTESISKLLAERFGVKLKEGKDFFDVDEALTEGKADTVFDYSGAKTLVKFCNGMWCGQSPTAINTLKRFGYPDEKMKWYRGGMQNWSNLGLTTAKGK